MVEKCLLSYTIPACWADTMPDDFSSTKEDIFCGELAQMPVWDKSITNLPLKMSSIDKKDRLCIAFQSTLV